MGKEEPRIGDPPLGDEEKPKHHQPRTTEPSPARSGGSIVRCEECARMIVPVLGFRDAGDGQGPIPIRSACPFCGGIWREFGTPRKRARKGSMAGWFLLISLLAGVAGAGYAVVSGIWSPLGG